MKNKFYTINIWFLITAFSILAFLLIAIGYSLKFLSSTFIHSFSADKGNEESLNFNIEKAEKLGL